MEAELSRIKGFINLLKSYDVLKAEFEEKRELAVKKFGGDLAQARDTFDRA